MTAEGGDVAIRLREINGTWIALCAVETDPKPGDVYIDDAQDHALRVKFIQDYAAEGILGLESLRYKAVEKLMESQKIRDAVVVLNDWINEQE